MNITREQFLNILFVARYVASTDGTLDQSEIDALKAILKALKVNDEELRQIKQKTSLSHALENLTSNESKQLLIDVLVFIACVDGELCSTEQQFIKKVMKYLSIDPNIHPYFENQIVDAAFIKDKIDGLIQRIQRNVF